MHGADAWRETPSPSTADRTTLPAWALVSPPTAAQARRARRSHTPLGLAALIASYIAIAVGIGATVVGVFCVGFITMFGAPLDVTRPAMAGFAVRGSAVTAVPLVIALVLLVIGMIRRMPARWWVAPAVINGLTIVGLLIASLIWYHPGTHISWDFSS